MSQLLRASFCSVFVLSLPSLACSSAVTDTGAGGAASGGAPLGGGGSPGSGAGGSGAATAGGGGVGATSGGAGSGGGSGSGSGGSSLGVPAGYQENLDKILRSTFRNTEEDDSPYLETPSAELYDKADLYGPVSAYKQGRGSYGGAEWFENEYYPGNGAGTFRTSCEVSHFAYDDPALLPGQPEASHLVMFIGNTHTNAFSTSDTILNSGGGTCNGGELNRTAYWVPAMLDGRGNVVVPSKIKFYYKTEFPAGIGKVVTYPDGLQFVADRSNNIDGNRDMATYRCNDVYNGGKSNPSNNIPNCSGPNAVSGLPGALEMLVFANYCWNGDEVTAGDWWQNRQTNLVKPLNHWFSSQCPATHPYLLPAFVTHIFYDVANGENTSTWHLSSDVDPETRTLSRPRGSTTVASWWGGWNHEINKEFVDNCNNVQGAECAAGMLADSDSARALRLRNDWITGPHRVPLSDIYEQLCSASSERPYSSENGGAMAAYCRPGTPERGY